MTAVNSLDGSTGAIRNFAYHDGGLEITFDSGRTYRYEVPYRVYENMIDTPSRGRYFNRVVRDQYPGYEVLLTQAVTICFRAYGVTHGGPVPIPQISFKGKYILIGGRLYAGGAAVVASQFLARAEQWLELAAPKVQPSASQ